MAEWFETDILITVRAFPEPSAKYRETSCVAGVDLESSKPIRIFPVVARTTQIRKFEHIRARVKKSTKDSRPESHYIDADSIRSISHVDSSDGWRRRSELVKPFRVARSIEALKAMRKSMEHKSAPSLALIRPRKIVKVEITEKKSKDWSEAERAKLNRPTLFDGESSRDPLEFVPYDLRYSFECDDENCKGHRYRCVDWEASEAFRKWTRDYGNDWGEKFLQKFDTELTSKDLQFFVGTLSAHPDTWTIIGLYYPPLPEAKDDQPRNLLLPLDS